LYDIPRESAAAKGIVRSVSRAPRIGMPRTVVPGFFRRRIDDRFARVQAAQPHRTRRFLAHRHPRGGNHANGSAEGRMVNAPFTKRLLG